MFAIDLKSGTADGLRAVRKRLRDVDPAVGVKSVRKRLEAIEPADGLKSVRKYLEDIEPADGLKSVRKRLPDVDALPEWRIVGRRSQEAVERVTGRRRPRRWPWVAVVVAIAAISALVIATVTMSRRNHADDAARVSSPSDGQTALDPTSSEPEAYAGKSTNGTGLTAVESSLVSAHSAGAIDALS